MRRLVLIAHNLRSTHNVGSLLRTCEGLGVERVYLTGYTPYPEHDGDERLPHLAQKIDRQIIKTALGAEKLIEWQHQADLDTVLADLKKQAFVIAALEQAAGSVKLPDYDPPDKLALIVGREVEGLEPEILAACDLILEIPMFGRKESFNVVQAAAMALYHLRFAKP
ncbi:MAG TPA: TrmH family RNA methyltransferase [Candidatus Dormibacteraeota bacterium]|nr:TrmH family RNA methyltransferase [Candidatus Dormibacteraeota bacterium]